METLRNMPFEAIVGVVEDWPWFGAAQKVLCEKMSRMGGRDLARDMYASAALHVPERRKIISLLRLRPAVQTPEPVVPVPVDEGLNKNYRGAGDYFSQEQYEQVRKETAETAGTAGTAGTAEVTTPSETPSNIDSFNLDRDVSLDGFCTEALAEIYAEQGYYERAKDIYAKLILAEPEKNTYFASLIEKLNEKN